ncbi:MAG: purine nucleoside phosphorylase DeoD-type, partial [Erysipelotrichaceae bacterium]|nr:purine nucleoside phosphorylase DeoD-type [Erysipelotrichaceae bacterium]
MSEFNGTPHNTAKVGEIAKTVLMPGDPLRAKFIAENFLEDAKEFNHVRGMLGYTGKYKGHEISVMGHGMGIPSIAIYSYELYNFYGVENIIRIGSCGGYLPEMKLFDIILAEAAYSAPSFADTAFGY